MSSIFSKILPRPYLDERDRQSTSRIMQTLLLITIAASGISMIITLAGGYGWNLIIPLLILLVGSALSLILVLRGNLLPGQIILPVILFIAVTFIVIGGYGLHDIDMIAYAGVIIVASLTLGQEASLVFGFLVAASVFAIAAGEIRGELVSPTSALTNLITPLNISIVVLAIAFIQRTLIHSLIENTERAHENELKQIEANKALGEERERLEIRVNERTRDLQRRALQLRVAAEVGNAAASARDLGTLLNQTVRLISLRFGFFHVGLFLLDSTGRWAILQAASSEGGQRMLERGHQLEVGHQGIVGYASASGEARIALDVGKDAVFFDNPDLPETRSEMALPLKISNRILGVLDIQSSEAQAFTDEDIQTLQVMADQLAIAIENARLLAESQAAVETTRQAYGEAAIQAWKQKLSSKAPLMVVSRERGAAPAPSSTPGTDALNADSIQAAQEGRPVLDKSQTGLYMPILIRGQSIGVLRLVKPEGNRWVDNEIDAIRTIADQLSGALDSARLYEDAQRRAAKEQTIGEISSQIGSSANIEAIMRLAALELGKVMTGSEITIQLEPSKIKVE